MVELPITLTQDRTLFVILRRDEPLWREKVKFLRARGGMALTIVHPDYMLDDGLYTPVYIAERPGAPQCF